MKIFKITLLLTTIFLFASTTFSVAADCSKYKSIVQKKICEGVQGVTSGTSSSSDTSEKKKAKKEKKKAKKSTNSFNEKNKTLADLFKNLKKKN